MDNSRFKFRFWNKTRKIMETFNNSPLTLGGLLLGKNDNYEILSCTGLKDKNGKLIYEGDIVRYTEYEIDDIEPEWKYDEIVWGGKFAYPAFDLANNQFECNGLSYIINEGWTIEVIGNIYETPELLPHPTESEGE